MPSYCPAINCCQQFCAFFVSGCLFFLPEYVCSNEFSQSVGELDEAASRGQKAHQTLVMKRCDAQPWSAATPFVCWQFSKICVNLPYIIAKGDPYTSPPPCTTLTRPRIVSRGAHAGDGILLRAIPVASDLAAVKGLWPGLRQGLW